MIFISTMKSHVKDKFNGQNYNNLNKKYYLVVFV
jgi:Mor family transcriptional regulator